MHAKAKIINIMHQLLLQIILQRHCKFLQHL